MTPKITGPLFKWFGSKWLSSKHYPAPEHDVIFEPFAGSAGYSLRHHEKQFVLIKGDQFAGAYTTEAEAYKAGLEKFGNQPFLIKQVLNEETVAHFPALILGLL